MTEPTLQSHPCPQLTKTVAHLAARWASSDTSVLKRIFPLLAEGRPISSNQVSEMSGLPLSVIEQALDDPKIGRDKSGRAIELFGFTLQPTLHQISIDRVQMFSCCALVAHTIPLLIQRSVAIESVDPIDRSMIRLEIEPGGIRNVDPSEVVATMIRTSARGIGANVSEGLCSHIHHFANPVKTRVLFAFHRAR